MDFSSLAWRLGGLSSSFGRVLRERERERVAGQCSIWMLKDATLLSEQRNNLGDICALTTSIY